MGESTNYFYISIIFIILSSIRCSQLICRHKNLSGSMLIAFCMLTDVKTNVVVKYCTEKRPTSLHLFHMEAIPGHSRSFGWTQLPILHQSLWVQTLDESDNISWLHLTDRLMLIHRSLFIPKRQDDLDTQASVKTGQAAWQEVAGHESCYWARPV